MCIFVPNSGMKMSMKVMITLWMLLKVTLRWSGVPPIEEMSSVTGTFWWLEHQDWIRTTIITTQTSTYFIQPLKCPPTLFSLWHSEVKRWWRCTALVALVPSRNGSHGLHRASEASPDTSVAPATGWDWGGLGRQCRELASMGGKLTDTTMLVALSSTAQSHALFVKT